MRGIIIKRAIFILMIAVAFGACASGTGSDEADNDTMQTGQASGKLPASGTVTDTVICASDNSQSYAVYIPSYYKADRQYPCIFFYDSHARGSLPVRAYKDIAEKYGFVLVGSNVSKNGMAWEATEDIVKALQKDINARISVDPKRIYAAGFSGGARVASLIAMTNGGIAGVIGCSAGFPQVRQAVEHKFDYAGIVGNYDFNLAEMEQLDEQLQKNGFTHLMLTFDGIHKWPAPAEFETALLWMQVNAIKTHLQPANDTLARALKTDLDKRIAAAQTVGDVLTQQRLLDGAIKVLDGLTDVSAYQQQLALLLNGAAYKEAIALQAQLLQQEVTMRQELAGQFATQHVPWWMDKIAALNKNIQTGPLPVSQMNRRVMAYLGYMSYVYTNHSLSSGDLAGAENYIKVFKAANPQNPDHAYLQAICCMKKGDQPGAVAALTEAASLGYNEVAQLRSEPVFDALRNDAGYKKVEGMVLENYKKPL